MIELADVVKDAVTLSRDYPDRTVRVYRTINHMYYIRFDENVVMRDFEGVWLIHLRAFKNGGVIG